ncbi:MAG: dTDP-4-dehydrorhamnose reductase [Melioribacteraceae bacterium]|nr:dTDP-4-dehydrorhamnose reductase [Melioribacteraceae bacterium]
MYNKKTENNRIIIIGSNGMLGQRLTDFYINKNVKLKCVSNEKESFFEKVNYSQTDLLEPNGIKQIIEEFEPEIIINAAAYTAVDKAEIEKELALAINSEAIKVINNACSKIGAHFINISTDYVFDGENGPYSETDQVNPVGYYGQSKLDGERQLLSSSGSYTIVRTNVLYGPAKFGRPDFVKWVVNSLKSGEQIRIVTDQINNPTYLDDLVNGIAAIAEKRSQGIYNIGGSEFLSRYDFTLKIADFFKLDKSLIKKIITAELNQPAKRPLKSGLKIDKVINELEYSPRSINESLQLMQDELKLV